MASGRHGGLRDNQSRGLELDKEASRRKGHRPDRRSRRGRDLGARVGDSQGLPKKREPLNGYHRHHHQQPEKRQSIVVENGHCSAGGGEDDQKRSRLSGRSADREPGELSGGSGSEGPEAPQLQVNNDNGFQDGENGRSIPSPSKKRKFSPIVWDRDDGRQSTTATATATVSAIAIAIATSVSRKELVEPVELPPPPPPLPRGHVLPNSIDSPRDRELGGYPEAEQMEEDDYEYPTARNISSSRWADGNNALDDEKDEDAEAVPKKKRSTSPADSLGKGSLKKVPSPELGEIVREGSAGAVSKSSGSGRDDYMDIDRNEADSYVSDRMSETESEDEDYGAKTPEPAQPPQRCINMLQGCRSVDEFERLNKIDEGTYGVVYRARDKKTGEVVALKKVKMEKEREGFPLTSLREINILLSFHHPSIVDVKEVVVGSSLDSIFMVMEYMEHDLKGLMEAMKQPFSQSEVKCLMLQLLEGVKYLHDNWVLHRDLKTSNILLNNRGELKICDFGLARQYGSPLKPYTQLVVTLWYRAPELLLGAKEYSTAIDMWSLGCIMAELLAKEPLFNGKTEFDQLDKIFRTLGTPNEKIWPGFAKLPHVKANFVKQPYNRLREKFPPTSFSGRPSLSEAGFDLLNKLLTYDPEKRITAEAALKHDWFREVPLPKSKDFMPTFPAQHAQDRRLRRTMKSPDPLAEQRIKELQKGELGTHSLFG
ncbi:cyclin-dependent kinase G-2 [Ananas comosus]|uniref:Cyclin-dependent kinase G-2 n=1 Tax=Ananas comosus TaxID=4615 RepID=A0A6P5GEI9_ANACO|nr:cyclin-dependent kinase G-2 [Ananas comosus]XP_020107020.1 cyclin-dependent kinase G-2 [Ananas comosus]XP_020107021.1 cyclin-dependent kinase G-2 [Ananas comosus]XP_020107022.1 cyclin-dependent kinase G-2 [Ananas comosus]XP_020107023.1 cyclin-dependent kinase G-2 [Ananas comosus]XP_020107024.1 cyclin-dependent kinase G-2 [Ananas comosus]XP_020107025.1 cyclin-dependent kinase G-2 [Ananas comosus]XP_020107026.1 cyclin-dependent kinase G-2 [Ananas comosus]XP_020107027.1 cyclin-dependent kin